MTAGPTLTTDRLILKPKGVEDFEELCALWADAEFTRFIMGHALSAEDVWYRLLRDMGHWAALGHGNWTIRLKDGGDYVGSVGVLDFRREVEPALNAPELGWGIAPRSGTGAGVRGVAGGAAMGRPGAEGVAHGLHDRAGQCAVHPAGPARRLRALCRYDVQGSGGHPVPAATRGVIAVSAH